MGATGNMTERQHRNTVVKYTLDPSVASRLVALMCAASPAEVREVGLRSQNAFRGKAFNFQRLAAQMPIVKGDGHLGKAAIYDWEREVCRAMIADSRGDMCSPAPISLFLPPFDLRIPTAAMHSPVAFAHNRSVRWQSRNDQAAIKEYLDKEWQR